MAADKFSVLPIPPNARFRDLTGQQFGKLTVLGYAGHRAIGRSTKKYVFWLCLCVCGKHLAVRGIELRPDRACRKCRDHRIKHGYTRRSAKRPEYNIWNLMRKRCYNENDKQFDDYGGRGIEVCERWIDSFPNFIADMGDRPSPKYSIERLDNDGSYSPENCRWATKGEQARNKRNNRILEFNGESHCLSEWAEIIGISPAGLGSRLQRGYGIELALTVPRRVQEGGIETYVPLNSATRSL